MNFLIFYSLNYIIFVSFIVLNLAFVGLIQSKKNIILMLISIELMFISVHLIFVYSALYLNDIVGYLFSIFSLVVAGCEVSIGLAIIICIYKYNTNISLDRLIFLKG